MQLPVTPGSYDPGSLAQVAPKKGPSKEPRIQPEKCDQCLACWIYCPDSAVSIAGKAVGIERAFCKGCGICATECSRGAIQMVEVV